MMLVFITHLTLFFAECDKADLHRSHSSIIRRLMDFMFWMSFIKVIKHTGDSELVGQVESVGCMLSSIMADAWTIRFNVIFYGLGHRCLKFVLWFVMSPLIRRNFDIHSFLLLQHCLDHLVDDNPGVERKNAWHTTIFSPVIDEKLYDLVISFSRFPCVLPRGLTGLCTDIAVPNQLNRSSYVMYQNSE